MTALAALQTNDSIQLDTDVIVGGGYEKVDHTGLYDMKVVYAFLKTAASGAMALECHFKTAGGANFRQTFWMTKGTAKGGGNTYIDKQGKPQYLPGFTNANNLALLTVGKKIGELETEEKVVKLYDYTQAKEVPTTVQMFSDLINQPIKAGVVKQIVDKNVLDPMTRSYIPSGESREEYEVDKFFRASDNKTVAEILAQDDAQFINTWETRFPEDYVSDRRKNKTGAPNVSAAASKAPTAAPATPAPTTSLFS